MASDVNGAGSDASGGEGEEETELVEVTSEMLFKQGILDRVLATIMAEEAAAREAEEAARREAEAAAAAAAAALAATDAALAGSPLPAPPPATPAPVPVAEEEEPEMDPERIEAAADIIDLLLEIIDGFIDLKFEKYLAGEVIPWTVERVAERLREVLGFAFVAGDEGLDLRTETVFLCDEDPERIAESELFEEMMEERLVDESWTEDWEWEIPVAPLDSWGIGGVPVNWILKPGEAEEGEGEENGEGEAEGVKEKKKKRRRRRKRMRRAAESLDSSRRLSPPFRDAATCISGINLIYRPNPLKPRRLPWLGLSRSPPRRNRKPVKRGHAEGRGAGEEAVCTSEIVCPGAIYRRMPHSTQSALRSHYLYPQASCEACAGRTPLRNEDAEVLQGGAIYFDDAKVAPEDFGARFVEVGAKPQGAKKKEAPPAKKGMEVAGPKKGQPKKKKGALPTRVSFAEGTVIDNPKDPLNPSRLLPNIFLNQGVVLKAGNAEVHGPPLRDGASEGVKPENEAYFETFNINRPQGLRRIEDRVHGRFKVTAEGPILRLHRKTEEPEEED